MNVERRAKYSGQGKTVVKTDKRITMNIDMRTLDIICKCLVTDNKTIRRGQLVNLRNFIELLHPESYIKDAAKTKSIDFIKKALDARLNFNLCDPYMIMTHIYNGELNSEIVDIDSFTGVNGAEIAWMNSMISESLKFIHTHSHVDALIDICTRFKTAEVGSKAAIVSELEKEINDAQNDFRKARNKDQTNEMFSLRDGYFEDIVIDTYNSISSPRRKLVTGMQGMNEMLGGGFENGRCYVYFGLPGEGKSSTILNLIYQLKIYNKDYQTKDPTKRPCIVLLTMENTVTESIERLFGMATGKNKMTDFSSDNVIKMMREEGELYLTDSSPIDIIIHYVPSNSVDTSYLYTLTEDLEDEGMEVIAMFQDYIGRIRSTEYNQDTRLEYGTIVDEFKVYAEVKDIPIITVAQLNRDASKHIDEGRQKAKSDLVRLIGRSNISESMLILNNIDAGFLLAPETTQSGERYLGVQRIKIRYAAGDRDFVYLPYLENTLKLIEDYYGLPSYKTTMRPDANFGDCPYMQSQYHTNTIMDMGQVLRSTEEDDNFFSGNVININQNIEE